MKSPRDVADLRRTSRRLGFQTGLLVVGCLVVVGVLLYVIYERAESAATERQLADTTAHIDNATEAPPGISVVVVTPQGRSLSPNLPAGFPDEAAIAAVERDGRTRVRELDMPSGDYTVWTAKVGERITQAVLDRSDLEAQRGRVVTALLLSGAVGVGLASLVGAWLARRAVSPMADTIAMQRRFVADAGHELRTPLTLLSTRVQLLARRLRRGTGAAEERLLADVDGVVADTKVLTDILDELLVAADTRVSAVREPLDLAALVRDCVAAAAAAAQSAGVGLVVEGAGAPVVVEGSAGALRRAMTSLVDNALDHARSRVVVSLEQDSREVQVSVADDGPGIAEEQAPRLFERFTSSRTETEEPARSGASPGRRHYGLGLALVADVAAVHDGRVTARGHGPEGGAVLTLHLPAPRSERGRRRP